MSAVQTAPPTVTADTAPASVPARCVVVLADDLPPGLAANAAAVLALSLGAAVPALPGPDVIDADGTVHPGLIPIGFPVLKAPREELRELRARARETDGVAVIDFPAPGQRTTNYAEFAAAVAGTRVEELQYVGVLVHGDKKPVNKLTGGYALLR